MTPHKPRTDGPASGASADSPSPDLLFVDAIEGERARLMWGREAFEVPARLLPVGTREGAWLRINLSPAPAPPDQAAALREKLIRDDDGGDIKL